MKNCKNFTSFFLSAVFCSFFFISIGFAGDVNVRGYYRSDGTYVRPHIRSSPDSFLWNNYGPSKNSYQLLNPRSRDSDGDGIANFLDTDDNNNGLHDDIDPNQYSGRTHGGNNLGFRNIIVSPNFGSDGFRCNHGYVRRGNGCEQIVVPQNASLDYIGGWRCNHGYVRRGNGCEQIVVPQNASLNYIGGWNCNYGYIRRGNNCVKG